MTLGQLCQSATIGTPPSSGVAQHCVCPREGSRARRHALYFIGDCRYREGSDVPHGPAAMNTGTGFGALRSEQYLSLETFRKNGKGVRTPVWFAVAPAHASSATDPTIYVYTTATSGKVKRIRNNAAVRIAACNAFGGMLGRWIDARASIVSGEEARLGMRLINRKYIPWKQILDLLSLFSRHERVVLAIRPN